ncbi:redox-sensing transcriptional repressor Rex [Candidatus Termititenax persephonae]|uniref:Redox-sensing transcriptional repressor Rex n=1 Tax=Candidatus Termititenax persephonae TaxID=2218525 RepID=A0A388TF13_9BACT|nr:redox-sensing transcriptional repressor Rex [Candidatus Termititenax persephonae]
MNASIPSNAIKRLTLYHHILSDCLLKGNEYISSQHIAELLKIDDSQVRKDIALCAASGKTKVGYAVLELKKAIERLLGFREQKAAFIIGAGNLGSALAKHTDFQDYGLDIVALFDNDPTKIDTFINGKKIYPLPKLYQVATHENLVNKRKVEIALLTVPAAAAQKSAELLTQSQIKYIWNFTPTILSVPDNVRVCNENLVGNFLDFTNN